jgi:hypothetical protein
MIAILTERVKVLIIPPPTIAHESGFKEINVNVSNPWQNPLIKRGWGFILIETLYP